MDQYIRDFRIDSIKTFTLNKPDECKTVLKQNEKNPNFKIIHNNIRSLNKNIDDFKIMLEELGSDFDCVVLTETWQLLDPCIYRIPGYKPIYNEGGYNQNDGIMMYIREDHVFDSEIVSIERVKFLKTKIKIGKRNDILVTSCYRSPSMSINEFNQILIRYFENIEKEKYDFYLFIGDININLLEEDDNTTEYLSILHELGYISSINDPTRIHYNQISCIDHIFIKSKWNILDMTIPIVLKSDITDHFTTILQIVMDYKITKRGYEMGYREFMNVGKLNDTLQLENWESVYSTEDPNLAMENFIDVLTRAIEQCTENKQCSRKNTKFAPWLTTALLKSINQKNNLFAELHRNPYNEQLRNYYKRYKNKLTNLINITKRDYYKRQIQINVGNKKNLWNIVQDISGKKQSDKQIQGIKDENGELLNENIDIANEFNNTFIETGKKLAEKIKRNPKFKSNTKRLTNSIVILPTDPAELKDLINDLKNKKSVGEDQIRAETLKQIAGNIVIPLAYILNRCIDKAIWPTCFKNSVVIPIHKNGDKSAVSNYRPISLITNLSKVFEKLLKERLISFINKYGLFSPRQFGFREKISTEDAVLHITEKIHQALEMGNPCLCLFIDLKKAFDTVSHKLLLETLEKIGIRGNGNKLMESYLDKRTQRVKIGDVSSDSKIIEYGIPQGTVLGPVLFNLYVNELFSVASKGDIIGYADDTVIFYQAPTWQEIKSTAEKDFEFIKDWFDDKLLTVNFEKTHVLPFSCNKSGVPPFHQLEINTEGKILTLKSVTATKYLGIYLDTHLKWDCHIKYVTRKLQTILYKFKYLNNYLPIGEMRLIYFSLVESHIRYGITAWGGALKTHLNQLEVIQRRFLKLILHKNSRYNSNSLYRELKVMDIRQLFYLCVNMRYHFQKNKAEIPNHEHNTRNRNKHIIPLVTKSKTQRAYSYISIKMYNSLPEEIKNCKTTQNFKGELKRYIYENEREWFSQLTEI